MQLLDDLVILRVVLVAAAGVDHAGDAERVDLAHEVARRVDLVIGRQLRFSRQRRIEDRRIRLRQKETGRVAAGVTHDLAARRVRRILGIADRAQRGGVQQGAVVEVKDENRGVGRDGIQFVDCR